MIIGDYFSGDDNRHVKAIQYKYYGNALGVIFTWARRQYLSAIRNLDFPTTIQSKVAFMGSFDHRTLQLFHDFMAAAFRYYRADGLEPCLPFPGEDEEPRISSMWLAYVETELERIADRHRGLARSIVEAVCYQNPNPIGIRAEDRLMQMVVNDEHYVFLESEWREIAKQ